MAPAVSPRLAEERGKKARTNRPTIRTPVSCRIRKQEKKKDPVKEADVEGGDETDREKEKKIQVLQFSRSGYKEEP